MKTLITTGCSYSQHSFPCWNLWLGEHYEKHISFSSSGSGPRYSYIQIRDYFKYSKNIEPKDHHVVIQWSSLLRNDERKTHPTELYSFKHGGQVNNNPFYSEEYVKKHFNIIDSVCDLLYYVESLILLSKELGFKLHMFYMFEPWIDNFYGEPISPVTTFQPQHKSLITSPYLKSLKELYETEYFISPSLEKFCFNNKKTKPIYWWGGSNQTTPYEDHHPSPSQHFNYYKFLAKKMGFVKNPKEWESIVTQLESILSSKSLSKIFIPIWDQAYPYMDCLQHLEYDFFNLNLEFVKIRLKEFNNVKKLN